MSLSRPRSDGPAAGRRCLFGAAAIAAALGAAGCDGTESGTGGTTTTTETGCVPKDGPLPFEKLSDYCFFEGDMKEQVPAEGVVFYDVAAPLWSDNAAKHRFIHLPEGQKIAFDEGEEWQFPKGSILIKTFSFQDDFRDAESPRHILETRLLILGEDDWTGEVYRWNDEQTEATRMVAGERVDVTYTTLEGETLSEEYIVPNQNQCKSCHERGDATTFLGPFTHQLNRTVEVDGKSVNQLEHLAEQGLFDAELPDVSTLPAFPDPFGDAPIDDRARAYLHANCSHCHRPEGGAASSGLVLLGWEKDVAKNGACKAPAAAGSGTGGHDYDIVPGSPDDSIMIFRMSSTDPEIKMPELPNRIPDKKGVALVRDWIAGLEPEGCP